MFPRVYNLQGNATMYILERLQYVTLFKTLSTYIPILRIMDITNSNYFLHGIIKRFNNIFKLSNASTEVSLENVIIYQCFAWGPTANV